MSGQVAKSGDDAMVVGTPVASIGIRGTTVAGKAAAEGSSNSITLLPDDGGVGQIAVSNCGYADYVCSIPDDEPYECVYGSTACSCSCQSA